MQGYALLGIINILTLPALAQPAIVNGGVVNGASFAQGQAVAPGSMWRPIVAPNSACSRNRVSLETPLR